MSFLTSRNDREREEIIKHYMSLVEVVLRRFRNVRPADREDLRSAGYLGLVKAVDQWDPTRMPWERFAKHTIYYAMVDQVREMDWVPKGVRSQVEAIEGVEEGLIAELGRPPTTAEVAARMEKSADELAEIMGRVRATEWTVASLDYRQDTEAPWTEAVADCSSVGRDPEAVAFRNVEIDQLELILQRLTGRERLVLWWRFFAYPRVKQSWVAEKLGVHESRVSQIVDAAIKRARDLKEQPFVLFAEEVYGHGKRMTVRE